MGEPKDVGDHLSSPARRSCLFVEGLVGYILEVDKKIEEMNSLRLPALQRALDAAAGLFGMRRRS